MCGICGELRFDGQAADMLTIERMMRQLESRGPDHGGHWRQGPLGLGHRRLAIIDLSAQANQPMQDSELGLTLVFNGTIYNHEALRQELEALGYRFFSASDTEVILKAWHAWGQTALKRLQGMFAFAIWDSKSNSLCLARDPLGIKPLYYSLDGKRLRFASNSQALLAAGDLDTSLDPKGLQCLFSLHGVVPAPDTVLRGLKKLPPAHWLLIEQGRVGEPQAFWQLDARRPAQPRSEGEWLEAMQEALRQAVASHNSVADVPVGVLLSGGLDSSLLVALLAQAGVSDLRTFSVGFEDHPQEKGSEFEFSDQVVERYGTRHHKFLVPNDQVLKRLPEAVAAMAEPMFGQDAVGFYLLGERVSQEIKVVQSGQGADELFGGYFWYPRMAAETQGSPLERFARHYFDRDLEEYHRLVRPEFRCQDFAGEEVKKRLEAPGAETFMDAVLRLDVTTLIVDDPVKRVDNMTMAWGLEARVPFLDRHLVEVASQSPPELRLREGGKYPLKAMARGLLPDAIIDRPKGYFPMPALKFVRGEFLEFMRDILDSRACHERGLYQRSYVELLLSAPEMHHTRILGSKLWQLALLEFWLQTHLKA